MQGNQTAEQFPPGEAAQSVESSRAMNGGWEMILHQFGDRHTVELYCFGNLISTTTLVHNGDSIVTHE